MQATPLPQADTPATRWGLVMSGLLTVGVSFGLIDAAQVYLRSSMLGRSYSWSMALLDANHPYAGWSLRFDIQVLKVEAASPEDVEGAEATVVPDFLRAVAAHDVHTEQRGRKH